MLIYLQAIPDPPEQQRFRRIYDRYRDLMLHTARRILTDPQDAEDAVQEAFFAIARNISSLSDPESSRTRSYAVIVTERKAIDLYRRRKRQEALSLQEESYGLDFPAPSGVVAQAIAKLPPRDREFVILKYAEGYTNRELMGMLDLSYAAIHSIDHRMKQRLRALLREEGMEV
ncbi:MAG: sigma-70 family RNA polymerase sigma factor [Oscillibacter sp.]|nr:sigma-70 family RNA polymerase sigma factor [Oscillibacter sp.]MBQ2996192.1 sigma-70 family RNA polymerase sigma factor [Oscillibacter sp.]